MDDGKITIAGHSQVGNVATYMMNSFLDDPTLKDKLDTLITYDATGISTQAARQLSAKMISNNIQFVDVSVDGTLFSSIINAVGTDPKTPDAVYIPIKTAGHNFIGLESHFIESISDELDSMMVTGRAGVNIDILAKTSQIASLMVEAQAIPEADGSYDDPLNIHQLTDSETSGTTNLAEKKANIIMGSDGGETIILKDSQTASKTVMSDGEIQVGLSGMVYGQGGDDVLIGNKAANFLHGRSGKDTLYGGAGADKFTLGGTKTFFDVVTDFSPGEGDKLRIDLDEADITAINAKTSRAEKLAALADAAEIRWGLGSYFSQTSATNDNTKQETLIYDTKGTASLRDDVTIMVLEDFTDDLTWAMFEIA